eukprot:TRINITY_DN3200_c0_g1_i1.p1 TRINITY_DN3200_c0_g1~~TRINITY_DN3200_c0_g1_i1.p1  ORF type:complete len:155 (-),score=18.48 TRINITY_DN3200_c0_g1_i1:89-553(-)
MSCTFPGGHVSNIKGLISLSISGIDAVFAEPQYFHFVRVPHVAARSGQPAHIGTSSTVPIPPSLEERYTTAGLRQKLLVYHKRCVGHRGTLADVDGKAWTLDKQLAKVIAEEWDNICREAKASCTPAQMKVLRDKASCAWGRLKKLRKEGWICE